MKLRGMVPAPKVVRDVVIIGGGGHAKVLASIILKISDFRLLGYSDLKSNGVLICVPYLGRDEQTLSNYSPANTVVAIGVGKIGLNPIRQRIVESPAVVRFNLPEIVSPSAIVNNAKVYAGAQIFDGVVVNAGATIGAFAIINTNATIEHDVKIGEFTHIAPNVTICGEVEIGDNCMIGAGSVVIQGVKICENVVVGAGSVVLRDITQSGVYVGNPVKRIK